MGKNKHIILGLLIISIVAIIMYYYYEYTNNNPSTDDAYVMTKIINVAPKVGGYISAIYVQNNQFVHKGQLLFTIDPIDYNFKLDEAKQNYAGYVSQVAILNQQLEVQNKTIQKDQYDYNLSKEVANRYKQLLNTDTISLQAYDNAKTNMNKAKSELEIDMKRKQQYKSGLDVMIAKMKSSKVTLNNAKSIVNYTSYYSPTDGYISNLNSINSGELIAQGQQIFGIVSKNDWWIDANFKETQIKRIAKGQKVFIKLDMYNHQYTGTVDSISYASGSTFSLLPAQNSTGNWVKITQRFSVRILVNNDHNFPLRVGASAVVKINTGNSN